MTKDVDRDIVTIKYNSLNLLDTIQFKNGCQIKNTYSAGGQKLGSRYVTVDGTDYVGNIEYQVDRYFNWDVTFEPAELKYLWRVHNPEGYVSSITTYSLYGPQSMSVDPLSEDYYELSPYIYG